MIKNKLFITIIHSLFSAINYLINMSKIMITFFERLYYSKPILFLTQERLFIYFVETYHTAHVAMRVNTLPCTDCVYNTCWSRASSTSPTS